MFSTKREWDSTTKEVEKRVIPSKNISNYGFMCITNLRLYTVFTEDATYVKSTSDATHVCETGLQ